MPDRTFFTLRYALPGYTFILMIVLVAFPRLQNLLQVEQVTLIGAFLAFLTLLSGGALGFLVSQFWYVTFNNLIDGRYGKFHEIREFLVEEYRLTNDRHRQLVFLDYVHRLSNNKETLIFTQRRYDLMHICGSTLSAVIIGSIVGIFAKADVFRVDTIFRLDGAFEAAIELLSNVPNVQITTYDFGVVLIAIFLTSLLLLGLWRIGKEHAMASDFSVREVVNSGRFPLWKAERAFTPDYFQQ